MKTPLKNDLNNKQAGFTLLEVMVVIVIIGILAAMSTVGFTERIRRDRIAGAVSMTNEFFSETSMRVKKTNKNYSLKINADSLEMFENIDCVDANKKSSEVLPDGVSFGGLSGLPNVEGVAVPTSNAYGGGWDTNCRNFLRTKIGNTVDTTGVLVLKHKAETKMAGVILKTAGEIRFQSYIYDGSDWKRK